MHQLKGAGLIRNLYHQLSRVHTSTAMEEIYTSVKALWEQTQSPKKVNWCGLLADCFQSDLFSDLSFQDAEDLFALHCQLMWQFEGFNKLNGDAFFFSLSIILSRFFRLGRGLPFLELLELFSTAHSHPPVVTYSLYIHLIIHCFMLHACPLLVTAG